MRNIEASAWVGNPSLQLIENKDQTGTGLSRFRLRFEQRRGPAAEVSAPAGAQAKPAGAGTAKPIKPQKPT